MTAGAGLLAALRVDAPDDPRTLFDVRRVGPVPAWCQGVLGALLFGAAGLCTPAEYLAKGTTFGFGGPGFNVLVAPIYEELIFRGWILGRLARARSATLGIAVSSLLFGLLHLRNIFWIEMPVLVRSMLYAGVVLGPILGWVTLRCRSVWPAVILHYLNNLTYFVHA